MGETIIKRKRRNSLFFKCPHPYCSILSQDIYSFTFQEEKHKELRMERRKKESTNNNVVDRREKKKMKKKKNYPFFLPLYSKIAPFNVK